MWKREIVRSAEVIFLLNSKNRKYRGLQPGRLAAGRWAVRPASPASRVNRLTGWSLSAAAHSAPLGPGLLIGADRRGPARLGMPRLPRACCRQWQGHPFKFRQPDQLVRACRVNRLTGWSLSAAAHWVRAY